MSLNFSAAQREASFLDPFNKFAPTKLTVEVRTDPLCGDQARVLHFRARDLPPVDHSVFLERSKDIPCPFCPDNLIERTARFLPEQVPEGRLSLNEAVCFPNAFPYEALNAVVVLTREHYVKPAQFSIGQLADGIWLAREAFRILGESMVYGSVNWNYMMPAGAGLIHPHFQIAAGRGPTRFQARLRRRAMAHTRKNGGTDIADDYLKAESQAGQRWLGRLGPAGWVVSFAPRAIYDIMALVPGRRGLMDLSRAQVEKLAQGIARVLRFFEAQGVAAFNMGLHTQLRPGAGLPMLLRLVSRVEIPPMGVDEINYFEKLHDEMLTFLRPEDLAKRLKKYWRD